MSTSSNLTLRIEHASGEVSELVVPTPVAIDSEAVTLVSIRTERALDRVARAEATVFRAEWIDVESLLNPRDDELYIVNNNGENLFGGRLDDYQFGGTTVSVQIDSFERDGREMKPPSSFSRSGLSDATIAADLINLIPAPVSVGIVEETTPSIDYAQRHTAPAVMLRELSGSTGADVRYRADGTVDYLARRGADKGDVISPSSGAVISEPRIRRAMREDTTNVRVLSQSDDSLFEEAEAVSTGSDGREVWELDEINSTSSSRLQARATEIANEVAAAPSYIEVETALDANGLTEAPEVGDRYTLSLPAADISTQARVIEADRVIDADGDRFDNVLLSNRKLTLRGR